ncbi:aspartate/glutamate racemase family protein [Streptomyces shenzhenensis]|uniref:aspartate/glutamate racemase family protein n=1 Tax=Streptomyces shenzhenensis TaxID=943815 RepID=UPI003822C4CF
MTTAQEPVIDVLRPIVSQGIGSVETVPVQGARVRLRQVTTGPASIEGALDESLAVPALIGLARQSEAEGASAVVVDCMGDPGLDALREAVGIPVLGAGHTAMHMASLIGDSFTVLAVLPRLVSRFRIAARTYGLESSLASVRSVDIPVLALDGEQEELVARRLAEMGAAAVREDGAHVLVLGCTGMIGMTRRMERLLAGAGVEGVPVIDPVPLAVGVAQALVRAGLSHSKRSHPDPELKPVVGYPFATTRG